jgi:hypothetical protein
MDQGNGTPATYMECMEFFLAPYPVNGTPAQGDPTKAPDVTTNSWTCPPSQGCSNDTLQSAVEAQAAAGIMMVVEGRLPDATVKELERRGHEVEVDADWCEGRLTAASRDGKRRRAAANPRGMQGYAAGR